MKVMVLRNTVASGQDIFEGSIVDISDNDARVLTAFGKVRPLTVSDADALKEAMKVETDRVLKNLPPEKPADTGKTKQSGKKEEGSKSKPEPATTKKEIHGGEA
jgi:hypothetical protein